MPAGWTMLDLAERLATALETLHLDDWHVLGIHSGNKIGAALCICKPEQVKRFIFAGMTHSIILDNDARNRAMRSFYRSPDAAPDPDRTMDPGRRLEQRWSYVRQAIEGTWDGYDPSEDDSAERIRALARVEDEVRGFESFDELYLANFSFDLQAVLQTIPVETVVMEFVVAAESHLERQADRLVAAIPRARAMTIIGSDRRLVSADATTLADLIRAAVIQPV
jgi:hypothetical protein